MAKVQYMLDAGQDGMMLLGDVREVSSVPEGGETTTIDGESYSVVGQMPGDDGGTVEVIVKKA